MKRVIKAAARINPYDKSGHVRFRGKNYFVQYTGGEEFGDPMAMLRSFKAWITEVHPYDDAEYVGALMENGKVLYRQNNKTIDKSYYMTSDDIDVEDEEWADVIIDEVIQNLYDMNKDVKPRMMHN